GSRNVVEGDLHSSKRRRQRTDDVGGRDHASHLRSEAIAENSKHFAGRNGPRRRSPRCKAGPVDEGEIRRPRVERSEREGSGERANAGRDHNRSGGRSSRNTDRGRAVSRRGGGRSPKRSRAAGNGEADSD